MFGQTWKVICGGIYYFTIYRHGIEITDVLVGIITGNQRSSGNANPMRIGHKAKVLLFGLHFLCGPVCFSFSNSHHQALDDGVPVLALVVHHLDVVQVGVGPVHHAVDQVQGDAVGEDDLAVHQLGAVLAVHVAALHPRRGAVVGEEHFAVVAEIIGGGVKRSRGLKTKKAT